jgi:diaminopimelate epimerase
LFQKNQFNARLTFFNVSLIFVTLQQHNPFLMKIPFYKYQGTGNDFVMIDNRQQFFPVNNIQLIEKICDRRFGVGADGLILLENDAETNFKMVYYNSDGNQSSMCGNGGRCIIAFAKMLGIINNQATFIAIDGLHYATILDNGTVSLQMSDVDELKISEDYVFLNTGSPHHVMLVEDLEDYDVVDIGSTIRYSGLYGNEGSNVNFVTQIAQNHFAIRTYERGVEDETLSCGTGATAVAIAMNVTGKTNSSEISLDVQGGKLKVSFEKKGNQYINVFLEGKAEFVFEGEIEI